MTQDDWAFLLSKSTPWRQRYDAVASVVRDHLATIPETHTITTRQLAEALYPAPQGVAGANLKAELYRVLAILAEHQLAGYAIPGQPHQLYGKTVVPWLWRNHDDRAGQARIPRPTIRLIRQAMFTYLGMAEYDDPYREAIATFLDATT